ncbi:endonuclease/exonuclease/phosphatase family protein [Methanocella arvoryzae]|uniref:Predicted endonuclease/exonuclease n=1 Tax=Methanocella arvoryzae (strain DSM 22066 / NBRC 105507 / MRE50) TaxID=351160 RepID=Q0W223_METAR|nr:endonuclease/exonuclease/phosphatase family protein [Methanocella arvoryzae]CAJ37570.1 predicted endonuclease/exonuclease [Methanocella arvoryzae MRE50]
MSLVRSDRIRLLSWNICFGGIGAGRTGYDPITSRENLRGIVRAILGKSPDVIVLQEYRDAEETGGVIKAGLREAGYTCHSSNPGLDKNGILIALGRNLTDMYAVSPAASFKVDTRRLDEIYRYRWANLGLKSQGMSFELLGIHIPDVRPGRKGGPETFVRSIGHKQLIWDALIEYAREKLKTGSEAIIAGDFNTGLNAEDRSHNTDSYYLSDRMAYLKRLKNSHGEGLADAWRKFHPEPGPEDYTWFLGNRGFRLDYVFLTPGLGKRLSGVEYSHEERVSGLSDHSMVLADIRL